MSVTSEGTQEWTISQEREFVENLVQQRFNFLLLIYSFVVAGALSAACQPILILVLTMGAIICFLISLTVYRAHIKLDILLKILHNTPGHPVAISGTKVKELGWRGLFPVAGVNGILIPVFCSMTLVLGSILAYFEILKVK